VIWSELFDREFSDVFGFLDEISLKIVTALELELDPAEKVALKENPTESPEAYEHYLKGRQYYYRTTVRDNELAEKEFQKALRLDPDYPLALAGLADAYVQRYRERHDYDEHWLDEADRLIERALELESDLAEAYESRAEVLIEKENYLGALVAAQKARDLRPEWDEPYLRLGEIYQYRGERKLALEMFNNALEIRPSVEGWCGRGKSFDFRGFVDSAEAAYRMAARHNPDHERPFYRLGWLYYYSFNDLEEAERMLRRAIEVRPDRGRSYEVLKELLCYGKGRFQEAEELIRGFAGKYPYHYDAYTILFEFLEYDKGDAPAALKVAKDAVARNPDSIWPHLLLADAYASQISEDAEHEKAVETVQKALELRPESSRVLRWAGIVYSGLGDLVRANYYYRRALEASPGSWKVLRNIAYLNLEQAHFDSAATVAADLIKQRPGDKWWGYRYLGIALTHLMRADEFLTVMQDAANKYSQDDPWFYVKLGDEQRLSGQYQEAMRSYKQVLDMRANDFKIDLDLIQESLKGLGIAQWLAGDTEGALASFSEAAETENELSYTLYTYMVIPLLQYLGRFDEIEERIKGLREDGLIDSWVFHANVYYPSMRRFDKALSAVAEAMECDEVTNKPYLALHTATWYRQKGDLKNAEKVLKDIKPSTRLYQNRIDLEWAAIEAARGNLDRALKFATKAYEEKTVYFDRNEPIALLSRLYHAIGRTQDALDVLAYANGFRGNIPAFYLSAQMATVAQSPDADEELSRVLLLAVRGSRSDDWSQGLGRAHIYAALASARLGDPKRARREIDYAIKLEPERADIAYYVAAAYSLVGDTTLALQWLETSVERGHQELWWARVDPDLDNLRNLPRFQEIMNDWDRRMRALID
jgi:tetratricopeptide (TPR) repeat protein